MSDLALNDQDFALRLSGWSGPRTGRWHGLACDGAAATVPSPMSGSDMCYSRLCSPPVLEATSILGVAPPPPHTPSTVVHSWPKSRMPPLFCPSLLPARHLLHATMHLPALCTQHLMLVVLLTPPRNLCSCTHNTRHADFAFSDQSLGCSTCTPAHGKHTPLHPKCYFRRSMYVDIATSYHPSQFPSICHKNTW